MRLIELKRMQHLAGIKLNEDYDDDLGPSDEYIRAERESAFKNMKTIDDLRSYIDDYDGGMHNDDTVFSALSRGDDESGTYWEVYHLFPNKYDTMEVIRKLKKLNVWVAFYGDSGIQFESDYGGGVYNNVKTFSQLEKVLSLILKKVEANKFAKEETKRKRDEQEQEQERLKKSFAPKDYFAGNSRYQEYKAQKSKYKSRQD